MRTKTLSSILALSVSVLLCACEAPVTDLAAQQKQAEAEHQGSWPYISKEAAPNLSENLLATNYLVILDDSGSMGDPACSSTESKFAIAKQAIKRFAASIPVGDNLGLEVLEGGGRTLVPLGAGPEQRQRFTKTLDAYSEGGGTPLLSSIDVGQKSLTSQGKRQLGYGTYRMVIVTDGESTDGDPAPFVKDMVRFSPVEVYAIGFCVGKGHSLDVSGYTRYFTAGNPEELTKALASAQKAEAEAFDSSTFN